MMFYNIVFIILVIIIASLDGKPTGLLKNGPERCCISKKYTSKVSASVSLALRDGQTYRSNSNYNLRYDANRGMIGMKDVSITLSGQQKKSNRWIIENMNDKLMYTIDQDLKTCVK
ncbi:unnamed protein product [Rotaria sp. Silwood1]|nr:unnamed protein product [Rotaria sp. Silwood1]CAF1667926.1 unnamed protein product [Rotaria sp. Silwood1]